MLNLKRPVTLSDPDWPYCVEFTIHFKTEKTGSVGLFLTIEFAPDNFNLGKLGKIEISLTRCFMYVCMENGKMPIRYPKPDFEEAINKKRKVESSETREETMSDSESAKFSAGATGLGMEFNPGQNRIHNFKAGESFSDEFHMGDWQVFSSGNENRPHWCFRVKTGQKELLSKIHREHFGDIQITAEPCKCHIWFETTDCPKDVIIEKYRGLLLPTELNAKVPKLLFNGNRDKIAKIVIWHYLRSRVFNCLNEQLAEVGHAKPYRH